MLIPGNATQKNQDPTQAPLQEIQTDAEKLERLLCTVKGAGKVEVLLSYAAGELTLYQTDTDESSQRTDTVTVTDANRNQTGLVTQTLPPVYQGAVIVCQGGADPSVRLAIVDAVSKFTGLGANQIAVLEMK